MRTAHKLLAMRRILMLAVAIVLSVDLSADDLGIKIKEYARRFGSEITSSADHTSYTVRVETPPNTAPATISYIERNDGTNAIDLVVYELRPDRATVRSFVSDANTGQLDRCANVTAATLQEATARLRTALPHPPSLVDRAVFSRYLGYVTHAARQESATLAFQ
jgi:hypothetical protein